MGWRGGGGNHAGGPCTKSGVSVILAASSSPPYVKVECNYLSHRGKSACPDGFSLCGYTHLRSSSCPKVSPEVETNRRSAQTLIEVGKRLSTARSSVLSAVFVWGSPAHSRSCYSAPHVCGPANKTRGQKAKILYHHHCQVVVS